MLSVTGEVPHVGEPPAKVAEPVDAAVEVAAVPPGALHAARASAVPKITLVVRAVRRADPGRDTGVSLRGAGHGRRPTVARRVLNRLSPAKVPYGRRPVKRRSHRRLRAVGALPAAHGAPP
ncbi:hypothetical protein CELD12_04650 [Cellulomonas sp. NTE-D12]|nr:hypothetical protein CELD12_04650 [Cellulomonas sp. NTE-D12]